MRPPGFRRTQRAERSSERTGYDARESPPARLGPGFVADGSGASSRQPGSRGLSSSRVGSTGPSATNVAPAASPVCSASSRL